MKPSALTSLNTLALKDKKSLFVPSFEEVSILRKYTILFLISSVIPMVLLYYIYFKDPWIGTAAMIFMVLGVLVGFFSIRSLLTKAIDIAKQNRKAIEPFLNSQTVKEFDQEKNELNILSRTFYVVTTQLEETIKELKVKNEELKELDQLKDDFVNNVSHELRLPLTVIQESIRQISEGMCGPVNEPQQKYLHMSLRNIDRLKALIDDTLDISKIEKGKWEINKKNIDLGETIKEVVSDFTPKIENKGLTIKLNFPPENLVVPADKDKITQVLINLIGNACKFTDKGSIQISAQGNADFIECSVADSGVGIPLKEMPHLFSKFHQLGKHPGIKESGTGLGLVITKHIIELHGGQIKVESTEGVGSTFTFSLPKNSGTI